MILDEIVAYKRREVEREKRGMEKLLRMIQKGHGLEPIRKVGRCSADILSAGRLEACATGFSDRLLVEANGQLPLLFEKALKNPHKISLIAEIKLASPSKGIIFSGDIEERTAAYEKAGASAISVVTEKKYFLGSPDYIPRIRKVTGLPILLKDFIIDEYQIYKARFLGAKAVLLICSILSLYELERFFSLCKEMGLPAILEVHSQEELEKALSLDGAIIGINNRNLKTFQVDLSTTIRLRKLIPGDRVVVSESGINTRKDVILMEEAGIDAILVGEALMRCRDVEGKIKELLGG